MYVEDKNVPVLVNALVEYERRIGLSQNEKELLEELREKQKEIVDEIVKKQKALAQSAFRNEYLNF